MIGANYRDSVEGQLRRRRRHRARHAGRAQHPGLEHDSHVDRTTSRGRDLGLRRRARSAPTLPDGRTINLTSATNMINCNKTTALLGRGHGHVNDGIGRGARTTRASGCSPGGRSTISTRRPRSTRRSTSPSGSPTTAAENDDNPSRRRPDRARRADGRQERAARRAHAARRGLRPGGAHRVIETTIARTDSTRARARLYRPARAGRAEPARAQGVGAEPRRKSGALDDVVSGGLVSQYESDKTS